MLFLLFYSSVLGPLSPERLYPLTFLFVASSLIPGTPVGQLFERANPYGPRHRKSVFKVPFDTFLTLSAGRLFEDFWAGGCRDSLQYMGTVICEDSHTFTMQEPCDMYDRISYLSYLCMKLCCFSMCKVLSPERGLLLFALLDLVSLLVAWRGPGHSLFLLSSILTSPTSLVLVVLQSALCKWGRMQMGSDGFSRIKHCWCTRPYA